MIDLNKTGGWELKLNINKYKNNGWGLSKQCFFELIDILNRFEEPNIVEFGSGVSTQFFVDYLNSTNKNGRIYSFEENEKFAVKINDPKLIYNLRNIVECTKPQYEEMFRKQKYDRTLMVPRKNIDHEISTYFYDILENDLPAKIDVLLIDGPVGFGRTLSYLHIKNKIVPGSYIIIDDSNRRDFIEKFNLIFPNNTVVSFSYDNNNKWTSGGNYMIFKINEF